LRRIPYQRRQPATQTALLHRSIHWKHAFFSLVFVS
jgi:hypothetical protein